MTITANLFIDRDHGPTLYLDSAEDPELRKRIIRLVDRALRNTNVLIAEGVILADLGAETQRVHARCADDLERIIDEHGWPGVGVTGVMGSRAAWLIAMLAVSRPAFMRRALQELGGAAARDETWWSYVPFLQDRILVLEGKPQLYATQFEWTDSGELLPWEPVEDRESLDTRRRRLELTTIARDIAETVTIVRRDRLRPPDDLPRYRREREEFLTSAGWRVK